jgi:hypothetical protein
MFSALYSLFQKVFRIRKAAAAVDTAMADAKTIAQQQDVKGVANAIAQTVLDAGDAASSVQDVAK